MKSTSAEKCALYFLFAAAGYAILTPAISSESNEIPSGVEIVGIVSGHVELLSGHPGWASRRLTHGGGASFSPLFSPDGQKIAFGRENKGQPSEEIELVVIDKAGRQLSQARVDYIGNLTWIDQNRLLISDNVNPSASNYSVIDAATGRYIMRDIFDSYSAFSFSFDGRSYVRTEGCPHFAPQIECNPQISVDGRRILSLSGKDAELVVPPSWSNTGYKLALVTHTVRRDSSEVVLIDVSFLDAPRVTTVDLPGMETSNIETTWVADRLFVSGVRRGLHPREVTFAVDPVRKSLLQSVQADEVDPRLKSAHAIYHWIVDASETRGVTNVDVWCATCDLSLLKRSLYDGSW